MVGSGGEVASEPGQGRDATSPIRVLLVDDHEVVATSLAQVLGAEPDIVVVGVADSVAAARAQVTSARPDVVLLDHRLPDGDGVAAIGSLLQLRPTAQVVVLTASTAEHVLISALEAGAAGFLSKTRSLAEVTSAVRAAAVGESVVSPEMLAQLLPRLGRRRTRAREAALTDREREVLDLIARGLSNAAIAEELVVSVHTVRNHVANLSAKLGAHSKLEALSIAVSAGLLPDR